MMNELLGNRSFNVNSHKGEIYLSHVHINLLIHENELCDNDGKGGVARAREQHIKGWLIVQTYKREPGIRRKSAWPCVGRSLSALRLGIYVVSFLHCPLTLTDDKINGQLCVPDGAVL